MSSDVVGVDTQSWLVGEAAFDTAQAFVAADAVAPISIELEPTLEYHPSQEKVGTASLQTETEGKRGGTWSGEWYAKINALGTPPDISELLRCGMGRMEFDITVLDYTQAATETITTTVGSTATIKTNGTDFTAATSNDITAGLIATELSTIAGVTATASSAIATVVCDTAALLVASSLPAFVSVTRLGYSLRGQSHALQGLQIGKHVGQALSERANGCWIEQLEFQITGNDECKIRGSGGFASFSQIKGLPQSDTAGYASGATVITLGAGHSGKIVGTPRVYFELVSDPTVTVGASTGYSISSVDLTAGTITLGEILGGSGLTGAAYYVRPWVPSQTLAGTILGGIDAGLTVAADSIGLIDYKLTLNTGAHGRDKEASSNRATGISRGERTIEGEVQAYQLDENSDHTGLAWNGNLQLITARMGPDVSGSRVLLTCPSARFDVAKTEVPEKEEATVTAKFMPRQSAVAEDEFRVELT